MRTTAFFVYYHYINKFYRGLIMNTEACRVLLNDAWIGVTAHNTYWTCDPDYITNNFADDEVLAWTAKIITGDAKLGYSITNETLVPALID